MKHTFLSESNDIAIRPLFGFENQLKRKKSLTFQKASSAFRLTLKNKSDRGSATISEAYKELRKNINSETEYSPPRLHTATRVLERAIQTLKNLIFADSEDKMGFTKSINRAMRVLLLTIHTELKVSPLQLYHFRKPRTIKTSIIEDNKTFLSN